MNEHPNKDYFGPLWDVHRRYRALTYGHIFVCRADVTMMCVGLPASSFASFARYASFDRHTGMRDEISVTTVCTHNGVLTKGSLTGLQPSSSSAWIWDSVWP